VLSSTTGFKTANSEGKSFLPVLDYGSGKVLIMTRSSVFKMLLTIITIPFCNLYKNSGRKSQIVGVVGNTILRNMVCLLQVLMCTCTLWNSQI
jgi:hypothetical protein